MSDDWRDLAVCRSVEDKSVFFPDKWGGGTSQAAAAKAICATCPCQLECLNDALERNEQFGIWGGATTVDRNRIRRRLKAQGVTVARRQRCAAPNCSEWFVPDGTSRKYHSDDCSAAATQARKNVFAGRQKGYTSTMRGRWDTRRERSA